MKARQSSDLPCAWTPISSLGDIVFVCRILDVARFHCKYHNIDDATAASPPLLRFFTTTPALRLLPTGLASNSPGPLQINGIPLKRLCRDSSRAFVAGEKGAMKDLQQKRRDIETALKDCIYRVCLYVN